MGRSALVTTSFELPFYRSYKSRSCHTLIHVRHAFSYNSVNVYVGTLYHSCMSIYHHNHVPIINFVITLDAILVKNTHGAGNNFHFNAFWEPDSEFSTFGLQCVKIMQIISVFSVKKKGFMLMPNHAINAVSLNGITRLFCHSYKEQTKLILCCRVLKFYQYGIIIMMCFG